MWYVLEKTQSKTKLRVSKMTTVCKVKSGVQTHWDSDQNDNSQIYEVRYLILDLWFMDGIQNTTESAFMKW